MKTRMTVITLFVLIAACSQTERRAADSPGAPATAQEPVTTTDQPQAVDQVNPTISRDRAAQTPTTPVAQMPGRSATRAEAAQVLSEASADYAMKQTHVMGNRIAGPGYHPTPPSYPGGYIEDRENYAQIETNPLRLVSESPVSTFSIDVDTGSYANVRRMLREGRLPPSDAVRVEELINYFSYDYPAARRTDAPFNVVRELAPAPWDADKLLLHIGIKGYLPERGERPPANLVFLVDVSGSMNTPDKIGLLKNSLKLLSSQLSDSDRVSLVVYAGASGVVLEPTPGNRQAVIAAALDRLQAGGSTNGAAGIQLAYAMAEQAFDVNGINRVILATDGDFNVGTTNLEALKDLVAEKRRSGIALTTLGFGRGNYNDALMEQIADIGNGNYAYIDTLNEAQKVLVDELESTMMTIAKDVKIQIEFNPALIAEYRLIGYENRMLRREDFNNDQVDAGEIGAGHSVTAVYELTPSDSGARLIDPLRYQREQTAAPASAELAFLRLRYKQPNSESSNLLEWPIKRAEQLADWRRASDNFRFSAAVAAFGQQLRGATYLGQFSYTDTLRLANGARGDDRFGYRGEFASLVNLASSLSQSRPEAGQGDD